MVGKNVADTGVGGGENTSLPSSVQVCGTSRPNIQVVDVGPYA